MGRGLCSQCCKNNLDLLMNFFSHSPTPLLSFCVFFSHCIPSFETPVICVPFPFSIYSKCSSSSFFSLPRASLFLPSPRPSPSLLGRFLNATLQSLPTPFLELTLAEGGSTGHCFRVIFDSNESPLYKVPGTILATAHATSQVLIRTTFCGGLPPSL
ncbi:hypothetical protein BJV74DRAFT_810750 [Russula compacta]|nr:hypothetical protein BJV74DRAFT_810750 [Russula compacta]